MTSFICVITEAHLNALEGPGASRKASFQEGIAQGAVMAVHVCPSRLHHTRSRFCLQHGLWTQTSLDSPLLLKALISFCKPMNQGRGHLPLRVAGTLLGVLIHQPS